MHGWYVYIGRGTARTAPETPGGNSTTFCADEVTAKACALTAYARGEFRGAGTVKGVVPQKFVPTTEVSLWLATP
jgi:hypothetical protein